MATPFDGKTIVVALSGGIACYKACEIVRMLVRAGARVRVLMTAGAQAFVTPLTLQTLSGHPVAVDTFDCAQEAEIGHIRLADEADLLLVAPATANVLAKLAHGIADDLLGTVALATRAPLVLAPAMNVNMWAHAATQENVARLEVRGAHVVGPGDGALACGWEGPGRLSEPADIVETVARILTPNDLIGVRVLVSAGPTEEPIDPVRFVSNRSSGKMGYAVARMASRRGAAVVLVSGPTALAAPPGVTLVSVHTAAEMTEAMESEFAKTDVVVMAAAVADYRPRTVATSKMKKRGASLTLALDRTTDILAGLGARKRQRAIIGFAAETGDVVAEARRKLREKQCDLVVANDVTAPGAGFASDTNVVRLVDRDGLDDELPLLSKDDVADRILDWVVRWRTRRPATRRASVRRSRRRSRA